MHVVLSPQIVSLSLPHFSSDKKGVERKQRRARQTISQKFQSSLSQASVKSQSKSISHQLDKLLAYFVQMFSESS